MPKGLVDSLKKFDLNEYYLSHFFSEVMLDLGTIYDKGPEELDGIGYARINCASRILRDKSKEFRLAEEGIFDVLFFWEFYGKNENERNREHARKIYADKLLILSEELSLVKDLPKEEVRDLADTCAELSKKIAHHWNSQNPDGFKKY